MDEYIYRFMSFESFVDMVQRQALRFVSLYTWDDPYEGFVFKALKTEEGQKKIQYKLDQMFPSPFSGVYANVLKNFEHTVHCQSWTECPESDALWRIYSYNNCSVRIKVSKSSIEKLDGINIHKIDYVDSSLEDELEAIYENIVVRDGMAGGPIHLPRAFKYKRKAFEHEKEIRLLTKHDLKYFKNDSMSIKQRVLKKLINGGTMSEDEFKSGLSIEKAQPIKFISYGHIDSFIESVMLHPLANDWFDETVSKYCSRNGINYEGKSNLYRLSI